MPDEIMKLGITLDPTGAVTGGTQIERIMLRMAAATEATEIEIAKLIDMMLTTPGAATRVSAALDTMAASEVKVATASEMMIAGMSASAVAMTESEKMIAGMSFAAQDLSVVGLGGIASAGHSTDRALHILGRRFGHMAGEVAGLGFGASRAGEQLMMLGIGGAYTVAITAGIFLIGKAFEMLTTEASKTRKETDELVKSLGQAGAARLAKMFPGGTEDEKKKETELLARLTKARKKLKDVTQGSDLSSLAGVPFFADTKKVKEAKDNLHDVNNALEELYGAQNDAFGQSPAEQNRIYFQGLNDELAKSAFAVNHTSAEVEQYAVNFDRKLNPAQQAHIKNQLKIIDLAKRVHDAMAEQWTAGSNAVPGAPFNPYSDNLIPSDSKGNYAPGVPDFLKGTGQGINSKSSADAFLARQKATTQHYVDIWTEAAAQVQDAIIGVFESSSNDHVVTDFFNRILTAFRNMLAEMAFEAMRSGIEKLLGMAFGFIVSNIGGGAKDALQNAGGTDGVFHPEANGDVASIGPSAPATTTVVHQTVQFNVSAIDARGVQAVLMDQRGTIAAIVSQAAGQSRAFRRSLGGN
jgi:hypothetical protein